MNPIYLYFQEGIVPQDNKLACALRSKVAQYIFIGDALYRRSFLTPFLECIDCVEADYCMLKVHKGICESHSSGEVLAHYILRQGYYWSTLRKDCLDYVKACAKFQRYALVPKIQPTLPMAILSPVPFNTCGMDIMGPFPLAKRNIWFLIVSVDYMMKWVEAKAVAHTTSLVFLKFFYESIVTRFGIPRVLITDIGQQFFESKFEEYLVTYGIQHKRSSIAYPQSIGQVEVTNRSLLQSLRKNV